MTAGGNETAARVGGSQRVKKARFELTKGHGPLRTAAPTGWFLAVIYVIMVKNTLTRRLFPQKKRRNRAEARHQIVEKNPAKRFFDSLTAARVGGSGEVLLLNVCGGFFQQSLRNDAGGDQPVGKPTRAILQLAGQCAVGDGNHVIPLEAVPGDGGKLFPAE